MQEFDPLPIPPLFKGRDSIVARSEPNAIGLPGARFSVGRGPNKLGRADVAGLLCQDGKAWFDGTSAIQLWRCRISDKKSWTPSFRTASDHSMRTSDSRPAILDLPDDLLAGSIGE